MKMKTLALALSIAAVTATSGSVQAEVLATSMVDITNFQILGSDGNPLNASTDFIGAISFTSTADQDVTLGSATAGESNPGSITGVNFAPSCVGSCPVIVDDVFPVLSGSPTSNYAAADQIEEGSPIANLPSFDPAASAHIGNGSYVGIASGTTAGSANSNNNLNAKWTFVLNQDQDGITFDFDLRAYLEVTVTGDEINPTFATANYVVFFEIVALTGPTAGQPVITINQLNKSLSLNAPLSSDLTLVDFNSGQTPGVATNIHVSQTSSGMQAGIEYQLTARINTNVDAARVPEPSIVALFGLGLMGLGLARARRRRV